MRLGLKSQPHFYLYSSYGISTYFSWPSSTSTCPFIKSTIVTAVVYVDTPEVKSFTATIVDLMNGQVEVEEGQEKYVEVPYELYK